MDIGTYEQRVRSDPCFICAFPAADPDYDHEVVLEDEERIAGLPPGVPCQSRRFHSLMAENGVSDLPKHDRARTADQLRQAIGRVARVSGAGEPALAESAHNGLTRRQDTEDEEDRGKAHGQDQPQGASRSRVRLSWKFAVARLPRVDQNSDHVPGA